MSSVRVNVFLPQAQFEFLKEDPDISLSEHIRRAVDEYIEKIKVSKLKATTSPSYPIKKFSGGVKSIV